MRGLAILLWAPLVLIVATILGALVSLASQLPLAGLAEALAAEETRFAIAMSLRSSLIALVLALLLGLPTAWLLARRRFVGKAVVETVLDLPMVTPPLVAGIGLLLLLGREAPVGGALAGLGIEILFSPAGVILAQTYIASSVVIRSARAAIGAVDPGYAANAATLGLPPFWAASLVELPMAGRGLMAAAVLGWARALGEFGATLMLAGATRMRTETLPMAVYLNIASGRTDIAIACALILLALAFALLLAIRLLTADRPDPMTEAQHARPQA
ncbi:molybdate transport system permease protein [Rhodovulum sulfidophilum]|uniref:ABC transporter permease n=1 Tax=Rhodovulum sulfidophilum TaxID=35806 RepID=UPI0005A68F55|nr:ABC transporter permease [Rhodovulum sulfidophilum]ANB34353.1 ABC transporter [Rhodovulum sulfidophilum DSM 1374]ANB38176.1 ABC transporter [Rhodovulum sulfidophilum]MCW2301945.1 molybdate transport system permease protein [Rhodovulum sulfidophilum]